MPLYSIQGPVDHKNLYFAIEHISSCTRTNIQDWKTDYVLRLIKWVFNLLLSHYHQFLSMARGQEKWMISKIISESLKCATYHRKNSETPDADFIDKWKKISYDTVLVTVGDPPLRATITLQSALDKWKNNYYDTVLLYILQSL